MRKNGLLANSAVLMASVVVSRIAGLFLKIPLTNLLGGIGMGYYQSAYTVFTPIYSICASSLSPTVSALVAEFSALERKDKIKSVKSAAIRYILPFSLLLALFQFFLAGFISKRIIGNEGATLSVALISPCIVIGTATAIFRGYFEGLGKMAPTAVSQALEAIVRTFCGLFFTLMAISHFGSANDFTMPYISAAAIFGVTVSDLFGLIFIYISFKLSKDAKILSKEKVSSADVNSAFKRMFNMMLPITMAAVVSGLMNSIDLSTIILSIKSSLRSSPELYFGRYREVINSGVSLSELPNFLYGSYSGLVMTVFSLVPSLCSVFGKSALPLIASAYAKNDREVLKKEATRVISIVSLISIPSGLGLTAFSKEILQTMFPSRVAEVSVCSTPLAILCLGVPLLCVSSAVFSMLQAIGKQLEAIKITTLSAFIKLFLNVIFIPRFGLSGASLATLISYLLCFVLSLSKLKRELFLSPKDIKCIFKYFPCSLISVAIAKCVFEALLKITENSGKIAILVGFVIVIAVIFYGISLFLLDIYTKNGLRKEIFQ